MSQQAACGDIQLIALMDVAEGDVRFTLAQGWRAGARAWKGGDISSHANQMAHTHARRLTHIQTTVHIRQGKVK